MFIIFASHEYWIILIFWKTDQQDTCHIKLVLERLQDCGLVASPEKCSFYQKEVVFLRAIISNEGLWMNPAKFATITSWPDPVNTINLNQSLGFTNFYGCFIHNFSDLAAPLQALTQDEANMVAGLALPKCSASFRSLITAFLPHLLLPHFDFSKWCVLKVDCSGFASSAMISQPDKSGALWPVSSLSQNFTAARLVWQVHDQELGVIQTVIEELRVWLVGNNEPILVFSNHSNLQYFMKSHNLTPWPAAGMRTSVPHGFIFYILQGSLIRLTLHLTVLILNQVEKLSPSSGYWNWVCSRVGSLLGLLVLLFPLQISSSRSLLLGPSLSWLRLTILTRLWARSRSCPFSHSKGVGGGIGTVSLFPFLSGKMSCLCFTIRLLRDTQEWRACFNLYHGCIPVLKCGQMHHNLLPAVNHVNVLRSTLMLR